jgi:putative transport protein
MSLPTELVNPAVLKNSIAGGLAILASAVTVGLFIGSIRVRGVKLGVAGVLFSALIFGQLGLSVDPIVLNFLRDFTLILFMYAIGLQVGPGFVTSLRADGLRLNLLAIAVLVLGAVLSAAAAHWLSTAEPAGLFTGAFTTTPGVAAAQEALRRAAATANTNEDSAVARIGLAYSIAYPFGVIGPVLVTLMLRRTFKINIDEEKKSLAADDLKRRPPIEVVDFEVTEPSFAGQFIQGSRVLHGSGVLLSRLLRDHVVTVPNGNTEIRVGDIFRAVGPRDQVNHLISIMGKRSEINLDTAAGDVRRLDLVVTRSHVLRKTLRELNLICRTGVTIARVNRYGIDLVPKASLRLAFADRITVVGPEAGLKVVEEEMGNRPETLDRPQVAPIFLGIVLGVLVGSIPIFIPGMDITLRIGLAGGPLLAAIALSQLGSIGSIVWYMPTSSNQLFRDFGLSVFLACVGLQAGDHFFQRAAHGSGLSLLIWGAIITVLPAFIVGCWARLVNKMNFITLSGWVAGAMTSSTALLFANELSQSDAPAVAYAAVAPLATLIPILCAQVLAIAFH